MAESKTNTDKPRLVLTHGEKGGVGKTTLARVLADFYKAKDVPFKAFDAEGDAGQLLRFHGEDTAAVDVTKAARIAPVLAALWRRPRTVRSASLLCTSSAARWTASDI
jgi:hypothetical protein